MECSKCGLYNTEGTKYCGFCGNTLDHICPHCNSINPVNFGYCGQCASKLPPILPNHLLPWRVSEGAERRQLTVLFCDIVNSSAISSQIDPEELRELIREYRSTCSEVIARFGGHIAQHLGDGILVYFGYPAAHENDACRATHAGLAIIRRFKYHNHVLDSGLKIRLSVRVGIHTGLVVIGEVGNDKRALALGETPNIAARIQDHTEPNSVIVSDATYELLKNSFNTRTVGKYALKGFQTLFVLHKILNSRNHQRNTIISLNKNNTPLIGRDPESRLLLEKINQSRAGHGQFVLLTGESGIGKSRLVQFASEHITDEDVVFLECSGSDYYKNSFFHPVIEMLRSLFELSNDAHDSNNLENIERAVARYDLNPVVAIPALADLLSIEHKNKYNITQESTPQQKRQLIMDIIIELIQSMVKEQFVVLIAEDLQWIDPSTLEFLILLSRKSGLCKLFSIFTFRNNFNNPFSQQSNLILIHLDHLTRNQSGKLIYEICNSKYLPEPIFSEIIVKTDGIPIFIEELTGAILRSGILQVRGDHYDLKLPTCNIGIPSTLRDSLMSRLDSLGGDKELAQICSILGREFSYELLRAISPLGDFHLQIGLNRLINAKFLISDNKIPGIKYQFRHALLCDTAYESLLKQTRRKFHKLIASLIKTQFNHIINENPEILAHHCTEAGNLEESLEYWYAAGRIAAKQSANIEAIAHYNNGLSSLEKLNNSPENRTWELYFQTSLGAAITSCKGYADPEVERAYARARELCNCMEDLRATFPILCGLWEFYIVRAEHQAAVKLATELTGIARQTRIDQLLLEAKRITGTTYFWQGDLKKALHYFESVTKLQSGLGVNVLSSDHCQDPRVATLANYSCVLWLIGKPDQALYKAHEAVKLAEKLSHPFSRSYALQFLATVYQLRGERYKTEKVANELITLSEYYKFPFWEATGKMMYNWATEPDNKPDILIQAFKNSLDKYNSSGNKVAHSYFYSLFADLLIKFSDLKLANKIIDTTIEETESSHEKYFFAELLRIKGVLTSEENGKKLSPEAAGYFVRSLEFSQLQGAKSLTLKTITSISEYTNTAIVKSYFVYENLGKIMNLLNECLVENDSVNTTRATNIYSPLDYPQFSNDSLMSSNDSFTK